MSGKKNVFINVSWLRTCLRIMSNVKENIVVAAFFIVPIASAFVAVVSFIVSANTSSIVKKLDAHDNRIQRLEEAYERVDKSIESINKNVNRLTLRLIGPIYDNN